MKDINTYLFSGFLDSGKTTYIEDAIFHDYFHKKGKTLILSFEEGEIEYDVEALKEYKTEVEIYQGSEDITAFVITALKKHLPDRVYIEENIMMDDIAPLLPPCLKIKAKTALISYEMLDVYYNNLRNMLQRIVSNTQLVIFNRAKDKSDLAKYGNGFKLLNNRTAYLWESPQGYHEKAFGILVDYDYNAPCITLKKEDYPSFYLDASENIERYNGKTIEFEATVKECEKNDRVLIGNMVMTCCLADIQFICYECLNSLSEKLKSGMRIRIQAKATVEIEEKYHQKHLVFIPVKLLKQDTKKQV